MKVPFWMTQESHLQKGKVAFLLLLSCVIMCYVNQYAEELLIDGVNVRRFLRGEREAHRRDCLERVAALNQNTREKQAVARTCGQFVRELLPEAAMPGFRQASRRRVG